MIRAQEIKVRPDESKSLGKALSTKILNMKCSGEASIKSADVNFKPALTGIIESFEPMLPDQEKIDSIKREKLKLKFGSGTLKEEQSPSSVLPLVGTSYLSNLNSGPSPLDNTVAISNGGWIVSVANSTIEYDDMLGHTFYYNTLVGLVNDSTIVSLCDPVVLYDAGADRFIMFCITSVVSVDEDIVFCFSKSNNPTDGWWIYKMKGNLFNNGDFFDYPKLAVSTNEMYVTGNLFNVSTRHFNQAVLLQVSKASCYAGTLSDYRVWHAIAGNPFTLVPLSYGQGSSYGPGCYLVASDPGGSSVLKFYDLTDNLGGNPQLLYFSILTQAYWVPSNTGQRGTDCMLNVNDCRTLSGFYLDGIAHFVFHFDAGSGWSGIRYNRINTSTLTSQSSEFSKTWNYDCVYPSVVSYATSATDRSVMINFGSTGLSYYPSVQVVNCDNNMNWSEPVMVRPGDSYVRYTSDSLERWGDYTGISRLHSCGHPSIWLSGSYGTTDHKWNAWNAEVHDQSSQGIAETGSNNGLKIFPNPITETFSVEFTLGENTVLNISLLDISGKLVKELYSGGALKGENNFSFCRSSLSKGVYFLQIKDKAGIFRNEKIVVG